MEPGTDPIFIIGGSNSGTSILQRVLATHPGLCSTQRMDHPDDFGERNLLEVQFMVDAPDVMKQTLGKGTFRLWAHPQFKGAYCVDEKDWTPEIDTRVRGFLTTLTEPGKRLVAKSPSYTMRARLFQRILPGSSFIALVRNGYAAVEGIRRKRELDPERVSLSGQETSIADAALQWQYASTVTVSLQSFLERYLIVRYEDLVGDPMAEYTRIFSFLGLSMDGVVIPSYHQNLNDQQISRLTPEEINLISQYCWPMLRHFNYPIL